MKYSFAELGQNLFSRKFGGTNIGTSDPYLSGTFFIFFDRLPPKLSDYVKVMGNSKISSNNEIKNILTASCSGVTPPGGNLNKVELPALGGLHWNVPGGIDYGTSISLKFLEFNKTPILDIVGGWFRLMRDYKTGVTDLIDGDDGSGYTKSTYAGLLYYWTTSPDGNTVEFAACYDGVFPVRDPQDLYASDLENISRLDLDIEFNCDTPWREPWVLSKCQELSDGIIAASKNVIKNYNPGS